MNEENTDEKMAASLKKYAEQHRVRRFESVIREMDGAGLAKLPSSPALTMPQLVASKCGKKYRQALKGIFDTKEQVLNDIRNPEAVQRSVLGKDSMTLSQEILFSVRKVYALSLDGNLVNYGALRSLPEFQRFTEEVQGLWFVDPSELEETIRKTFFINLYNALVIHAIMVFGTPSNSSERLHFYSRASYVIGGRAYSLNDIEHGILRGNRTSWQPIPIKPFSEYDARLACTVGFDPRIHFALNCGARGCPVLRFYEPQNLNETLDRATKMFLDDIVIIEEENAVVLSSILYWYMADFGENSEALLRWMLPYLSEEKQETLISMNERNIEYNLGDIRVSFAAYDWTVNDSSV